MKYVQNHRSDAACVFCEAAAQDDSEKNLIVYRGQQVFAILNRFPYTSGHLMVVPFEHQASLDALTAETRAEMMEVVNQAILVLRELYHPHGFNVGMNIGEPAGAGIAGHVHMHVVPRWTGDTNFMSTVSGTRVLPEALEETYPRVKEVWRKIITIQ
jgi:ATP adenylyltransferase